MKRTEILERLKEDRARLLAAFEGLPDDDVATRPVVGWWTVKDLLGHMAMWHRVAVQFITDYQRDGAPKPLGLADDAAVDAYNARGAALARDWTLARMRDESDAAYRELVAAVQSLSDEALRSKLASPWPNGTTLESLIAINSYDHDPEHIEQISQLKGQVVGRG